MVNIIFNHKITKLIDDDLLPPFVTFDGGYNRDELVFSVLAQILRELKNQRKKEKPR